MILCSIDSETGIVRRYDTTDPDGLTHVGRLIVAGDDSDAAVIEQFRRFPPPELSVRSRAILVADEGNVA